MKKIKVHIYGLPHTLTIRDHPQMMTCAYTTKIWLLCEKLMQEGHEVIHYGVEIPSHLKDYMVPCTEHVACIPFDLWEKTHGQRDATSFHHHDTNLPTYQMALKTFPAEIIKRIVDPSSEVVLASFGYWSNTLNALKKHAALIEFGIGYDAVFTTYKVFESYSWMHTVYGIKDTHLKAPGWFDAVIPGYIKPEEFEFKTEKENYLLCLGRMIDTKGIYVAAHLAREYGLKIIMAGNGDAHWMKEYPNIEYVGVVGIEEKRKLLANAKATMCNTHYVEPFGNVHVESLMSGTPVITTDWGVYTETVPQGRVGFRGRTWEDFKYALEHIDEINPYECRKWAEANFTLDAVYPKFAKYFEKCAAHFTSTKNWYFDYDYSNYFVNYEKNYEEFSKTHIMLVVDDAFWDKGLKALQSFGMFHSNYDITIVNNGLSAEHLSYLNKNPKVVKIINNKHTVYWAKAIYAKDVAKSGILLILDADTEMLENVDDFLMFDNSNTFLHAVDDFGTFKTQNDFNLERTGEDTYLHKAFIERFPDYQTYVDNLTINAGVLVFNLNYKAGKDFLARWSSESIAFENKVTVWPNEQGLLNYLLYSEHEFHKNVQLYPPIYNSSWLNKGSEDYKKLKIRHYHNEEEGASL